LREVTLCQVPEGDAVHRVAAELQALVGERLEVTTPHRRAAGKGIARALDGRRLESVEAVGKNLLLTFEGGLVLRSHLRMNGRWRVRSRGAGYAGTPWLVLRGAEREAALWHGPVLELEHARGVRSRLGPDILAEPPALDAMVERLRAADQSRGLGEALLDQRLVAGIGNMWKAECLWEARLSPWRALGEVTDDDLRRALDAAHRLMRASLDGTKGSRRIYRRAGRPCPRCGAAVRSHPQGADARIAYWCPGCQTGGAAPAT
jgi:endonuclease-8